MLEPHLGGCVLVQHAPYRCLCKSCSSARAAVSTLSAWSTTLHGTFRSLLPTCMAMHVSSVAQSCLTLCDPMDCSPTGSSVYRGSPGKNTGLGCHFLLQGIFPIQGSNPRLLHWQVDSLPLSHLGGPTHLHSPPPPVTTAPTQQVSGAGQVPF